MINLKKIVFLSIKSLATIVVLFTIVLFFYAAFFYETSDLVEKIDNKEIKKSKSVQVVEDENLEKKLEDSVAKEANTTKKITINTPIEDGLFATVGNKAITKSDIVNELKIILILNNKTFVDNEREQLQELAIKSVIKRSIKEMEIDLNNYLEFSKEDLQTEIQRLAKNINMNVDTLKKIFLSNDLNFSLLENQIKTDLLWNTLIFQLYKNKISINLNEIDEQLKLIQSKQEIEEYLISEIVIKPVEKDKINSVIEELKSTIKTEGFKNVALNFSISDSSTRGGDLGWINENIISQKLLSVIANTPVGSISKPIFLPNGILIFKVRNKRNVKREINLEDAKNQLVHAEKERVLNMHSKSHYNSLRRTVSIKFFQ